MRKRMNSIFKDQEPNTAIRGSARSVAILSPAKINLSIDVVGKRPDGMHEVDMVMQAIDFCDSVTVTLVPRDREEPSSCGAPDIRISCGVPEVPTDSRNICWKAAELMLDAARERAAGSADETILIDIEKRVPVAAGMAGGSGNGAAVLRALNNLWDLGLRTEELMELGGKLGADVPFCVLAQADDPRASRHTAARARGTGTEISPVSPLSGYIVFAKPPISVSTKEVYKGIDSCEIALRPDNERLVRELAAAWAAGPAGAAEAAAHRKAASEEMINVLELYTLKAEPEVAELKALMQNEIKDAEKVLMSGSGPTVFALFGEDGKESAAAAEKLLAEAGYEAHCAAL